LRRAPLYPFFAAALLKLFGGTREGVSDLVFFRPVLIANCFILGATCLVVYRMALRTFGERPALLAAVICPLVPQSLRYVGMAEVETLMGLFSALLAFTGLRFAGRPGLGTGAAFGLTTAAATLTKPVVLLYPFAFLGLCWWYWRKHPVAQRDARIGAIAIVICFIAPIVPWSLRNMAVTDGQFKNISSNGPGEFLRGYINAQPKYYLLRQDFGGGSPGEKWDPEASDFEEKILAEHGVPLYRYNWEGDTFVVSPEPPPGKTTADIEVEKDRIEGAEMKRRMLHEPFDFARKLVVQLFTFWYMVETRTKSVFVGAIALVMLGLAAIGVLEARRRGQAVWPIVFVIVYSNAFYAALLALARYSMPLFPTLIALSAGGLWHLWTRVLGRRSRNAASA